MVTIPPYVSRSKQWVQQPEEPYMNDAFPDGGRRRGPHLNLIIAQIAILLRHGHLFKAKLRENRDAMAFLTKRNSLLILLGTFFVGSLIATLLEARFGEFSPPTRSFQLFCTLLVLILSMRWFVLDAKEHKFFISGPMYLMLAAFTILVAPFYFFATRGKGAFKAIALALGFSLLALLCSGLGGGVGNVIGYMLGWIELD